MTAADYARERTRTGAAAGRVPIGAHNRPAPGNLKFMLHDCSQEFRIVVTGDLSGPPVQSLGWAWETAKSVLAGRALVVDLAGLTAADRSGVELLRRMHDAGARVTPALELPTEGFRSPEVRTPAARVRWRIPCIAIRALGRAVAAHMTGLVHCPNLWPTLWRWRRRDAG